MELDIRYIGSCIIHTYWTDITRVSLLLQHERSRIALCPIWNNIRYFWFRSNIYGYSFNIDTRIELRFWNTLDQYQRYRSQTLMLNGTLGNEVISRYLGAYLEKQLAPVINRQPCCFRERSRQEIFTGFSHGFSLSCYHDERIKSTTCSLSLSLCAFDNTSTSGIRNELGLLYPSFNRCIRENVRINVCLSTEISSSLSWESSLRFGQTSTVHRR